MSRLKLFNDNAVAAKHDYISTYSSLSENQQIIDVTNSLTIGGTNIITDPSYIIANDANMLKNFVFEEVLDMVPLTPISGITYNGGDTEFKKLCFGRNIYMCGIIKDIEFTNSLGIFNITIPYPVSSLSVTTGVGFCTSINGFGGAAVNNNTNGVLTFITNVTTIGIVDLNINIKYILP